MRPVFLLPLALALVACPGDPPVETDDPGTDAEVDTEVDTEDPDTDTEIDGTDNDRDGWTVENGDCDDDDVFVNPAWEERANDDKDNDCDGRIDESLGDFMVFEVSSADMPPPARRRIIDVLGEIGSPISIGPATSMSATVEIPGEDTWLALDPNALQLREITGNGSISTVLDLSTFEEWPGEREPFGVFGLGRSRDGTAWITTANELIAVQPDGSFEFVADWACLDEEEGTLICPTALTVRATDGAVALFGIFGSVALWTEADGLQVLIPGNPEPPPAQWNAARSDEQGRLYALGTVFNVDGSQTRGVFRYNADQNQMVLRGPWVDTNGNGPGGFTNEWRFGSFDIDTVRGEYYVSANIGEGGATRRTLYRVFDGPLDSDDPGYAALLWPETFAGNADGTGLQFSAMSIRWDQD